jgi:hypothetical protein
VTKKLCYSSVRGNPTGRGLGIAPRVVRSLRNVRSTGDSLERHPRGGGCNVVSESARLKKINDRLTRSLGGEPMICTSRIEDGVLIFEEVDPSLEGFTGQLATVFLNPSGELLKKHKRSAPEPSSHQGFVDAMAAKMAKDTRGLAKHQASDEGDSDDTTSDSVE